MSDDGAAPFGPGSDKPIDIGKVSPEVLDELSRLFGGDPEQADVTVVEAGDGHGETVTTFVEVVEIVDESIGTAPTETTTGPEDDAQVLPFRQKSVDPSAPVNYGDPLIVIDEEPDIADRSTDVDPRFEERRRAWARRDRLKRVRWLKIAGLLAGLFVFTIVVMASPLFAVRSLKFEGNVYTGKPNIERVRKILKGTSIFTADTSHARSVLFADPWVADVRITTHFPSSVVVEISERVPVVWYVGTDNKARMVDARGHVIDVLDGFPTKYLQVKGTGPSVKAGETADDAYRAAAQLVLALPDEIRPKVAALDLSPAGELSMVLKGDTLIRFGTPADLQNKLVAVIVLLRRQDPKTIAVIDVSAGDPTVLSR
jgi:cell division protein FtsQ